MSFPHWTSFWRRLRYSFSAVSAEDKTGCSCVNREWRSGGSVCRLVPIWSRFCPDWEDANLAVKIWLCLFDFAFRSFNLFSKADVDIAVGMKPVVKSVIVKNISTFSVRYFNASIAVKMDIKPSACVSRFRLGRVVSSRGALVLQSSSGCSRSRTTPKSRSGHLNLLLRNDFFYDVLVTRN